MLSKQQDLKQLMKHGKFSKKIVNRRNNYEIKNNNYNNFNFINL